MNEQLLDVPMSEIYSDEGFNCRGHISPASVAELSCDVEKNGLIQPIVVQPFKSADHPGFSWKIIAGHRRHLACRLWHKRGGPATMKVRVMEGLPEHRALILNLKENLGRENLNLLQEARAIEKFLKWGWPAKRVAEELGVYRKWVETRFALLTMDEHVQRRAEGGFLNQHHVEDLARMSSKEERTAYVKKCVDYKLDVDKVGARAAKKAARKKAAITGEARSKEEMFLEQERIQDSLDDVGHPAAVALGWAAGAISTEDFYRHCEVWAKAEGRTFKRPPKVA